MDPKWFDRVHFGKRKAIQMNNMNYAPEWLAGKSPDWTDELFYQYLQEYRMPDGRPVTAFQNFLHCNTLNYMPGIALADVNVSCNPYFDVDYYAQQVADWANSTGAYGDYAWTGASVAAHIFNSMRMSLWEHFRVIGLEQMLNPSAEFDTQAYLAERAAAMNKAAGVDSHTIETAMEAIRIRGENPIMDYYNYGQDRGITPEAVCAVNLGA